jgi:DNA-binding NarL/FixJ family response regulator
VNDTTTMPIRVALVDDQTMVRAGFALIIGAEPDLTLVGEAADGAEAVEMAERARPDIVLMDIQMPGVDGIEATARLLQLEPSPKVIVLTTFERDDYIFAALQAGASGFLIKNAPPEDLLDAIRVVAQGDALLAPSVTRRVLDRLSQAGPPLPPPEELDRLTEREREVLLAMGRGRSNAEIAEELHLGAATVKTHVSNVLAKLELRDRVQAVVFAHDHNLVGPDS